MSFVIRYWAFIFFILSIIAISSALIAEHFFNFFPCKMCLYQRYPYYFIICIFILFYFFLKISNIWLYILTELAILFGLFYSLWHVGIEKKILPELSGCTSSFNNSNSLTELKDEILNQAIIACDEINWIILGLSAATINSLLLLFLLIFNTIFLFKYYYGK